MCAMGVLRPRRQVMVVGVVAVATVWMLAQGTRGAELALPVAATGLLVALARSGSDSTKQLLLAARRLARDARGLEADVLARLMADTGDPTPADVSFAKPAPMAAANGER